MKVKYPCNNTVLVNPISNEDVKGKSKLFVPDSAQEQPQFGTVLMLSEGACLQNETIESTKQKLSDAVVMFPKHAKIEVEHNGKTCYLINVGLLYCIWDEK